MLLLRYVGGGFEKVWYNSQEDDWEGVRWGYEILERLELTYCKLTTYFGVFFLSVLTKLRRSMMYSIS